MAKEISRCFWVGDDPLSIRYHDEEWGVPLHDDRRLFEMLTLEGAQAGLSWMTILRKREGYRRAFSDFDVATVARYGEQDVARLMENAEIVRNKAKIRSTIGNAQAFLKVREEYKTFDSYVWSFVDGTPRIDRPRSRDGIPARTEVSDALSKALLKRGFKFVGSTIMYAFMQACGLVDDHTVGCFRAVPARRKKSS